MSENKEQIQKNITQNIEMGSLEKEIFYALEEQKISLSTGIPCGVLKKIISASSREREGHIHIISQSEPESIGIASGATLAGKIPLVYMQNSGLMKSINDICSLPKLYSLPMIIAVSHRGCEGEDAPQHMLTGKMTEEIIRMMGIPYHNITSENISKTFKDAILDMHKYSSPSIILARRGWDNTLSKEHTPVMHTNENIALKNAKSERDTKIVTSYPEDAHLMREEALDAIIKNIDEKYAVISTTGLISRSLYERYDAPNIFYNVGGFGLASSIGLGFALSRPEIKTIIIDGDCSILTNMGSLVTIGNTSPKNLLHVVLDNSSYASCSEETSCSSNAEFCKSALLHGYVRAYDVKGPKGIAYSLNDASKNIGPSIIHIPILSGGRRDFKRPKESAYLAQRFIEHFRRGE